MNRTPLSPQEKQALYDKYQERFKLRLFIVVIPVLLSVGILLGIAAMPEILEQIPMGMTLVKVFIGMEILGAAIVSFAWWRCPSCNAHLGKQFNPGFCSGCGVPLHD